MFDLPKYGDGICLARLAELLDALAIDRARLQRHSVVVTGSTARAARQHVRRDWPRLWLANRPLHLAAS